MLRFASDKQCSHLPSSRTLDLKVKERKESREIEIEGDREIEGERDRERWK